MLGPTIVFTIPVALGILPKEDVSFLAKGILAGIIINIFAVEKIQTGMSTLKKKRGDWGTIVNSCFFLGIVAAFTPLIFASGTVYALTFLISMGVAALCALCMRRFHLKWLGSFIMSISLIVSMAASVLLEQIF